MIARMMTQSGAGTVGSPQRRPAAGLTARPTADPQSALQPSVCLTVCSPATTAARQMMTPAIRHPPSVISHRSPPAAAAAR